MPDQRVTDLQASLVQRLSSLYNVSDDPWPAIAQEVIRLMEYSRRAAPVELRINLGEYAPPLTLPPESFKV